MQLSVERRSFLSGEHRHLGWIEVPPTAPLHIKNRIVEWRHANIDTVAMPVSRPVASPALPALATQNEREAAQRRIRATQISLLQ